MLAQDIDEAFTEMLAGTYRVAQSTGSLLVRARATAAERAHIPTPTHAATPADAGEPLVAPTHEGVPARPSASERLDEELQRLAGVASPPERSAAEQST